ncbi:MAG: hypothetical protein JXB49_26745 [Bacteroidales bacterium]|nr:hypothetical protein [Bacteroidales bacterium]
MDTNISTWIFKFLFLFWCFNFGGYTEAQEFKETDSLLYNVPQEKIEVNKEIDENGNIIRYDSSYSWSYYGNSYSSLNLDSLLGGIMFQFPDDEFFGMEPFGNDFFRNLPFSNDTSSQFFDPFEYEFGSLQKMMEQHQRMLEEIFKNMPGFDDPEYEEMIPVVPPREDNKTQKKEQKNMDMKDSGNNKRKNFI